MNILAIPVQSISDLITNSSSEVFILDTGKDMRGSFVVVKIEEGWSYPGTIFEIANGWLKDPEDEEDVLEVRMNFLFEPFEVHDYGNGMIARGYSCDYKEPIHDAFIEYLNNNWDKVNYDINRVLAEEEDDAVDCIDWKTLHRHSYWFKNALWDISKEFLKSYDGPKPTVWEISKAEDVRRLDGKVLVVSNDDNSIPYDTWDKINSLFNGWNIHLG